jgi:protoporphyrin/coproporphyrin ferrochelatase
MSEAVLMVNVGSPDAPTPHALRSYLGEFLSDPRVIDIPAWQRWILVNLIILPRRPKQSAHAYQAIWRPEGSPLVHFSRLQREALEKKSGKRVVLGMAYGNPSLHDALASLEGVEAMTVVPMFPHYASATFGAVLDNVYSRVHSRVVVPALRVVPPFWHESSFLDALAAVVQRNLGDAEHLLLSYHGLPERQVKAVDAGCLASVDCCERLPKGCYRAQCLATSRELGKRISLPMSSSFQSRLGRDPWIGPSSDMHVEELAKKGVKRLAVATPSFVADCLETLEEIGIRLKETFLKAGGESFTLIPCLNDEPAFIDTLARLVQ